MKTAHLLETWFHPLVGIPLLSALPRLGLAGEFVPLSRQCSHEGYTVEFESTDTSFYCPLHGSRFGSDGRVLNGPATVGLRRYNVQQTDDSLRIFA